MGESQRTNDPVSNVIRRGRGLLMLALVVGAAGCAHQEPRFYPNATSQSKSKAQQDRDVEQCKALAESQGLDYDDGGDIAASTVRGGVIGGASGAVIGAVIGDSGRNAAVGAASGATYGFFGSLFRPNRPHPTYRNFVNRCLRDKGYDTIGWK